MIAMNKKRNSSMLLMFDVDYPCMLFEKMRLYRF